MHPGSGLAILFFDHVFFGLAIFSGGIWMPLTMTLAFGTTFFAVWMIQRKIVGESPRVALTKALVAGTVAGIPTSISGTFLGSWILLSAGLHPLRRRLKFY